MGVVTLGGSITHGKGGIHGGPYALRFLRWLNATWPRPQGAPPHRLANRGLPATPSNIFAVCVDRLVPQVGAAELAAAELAAELAAGIRH